MKRSATCKACSIQDPTGERTRRSVINSRAPFWCWTHRVEWEKSGLTRDQWYETLKEG